MLAPGLARSKSVDIATSQARIKRFFGSRDWNGLVELIEHLIAALRGYSSLRSIIGAKSTTSLRRRGLGLSSAPPLTLRAMV